MVTSVIAARHGSIVIVYGLITTPVYDDVIAITITLLSLKVESDDTTPLLRQERHIDGERILAVNIMATGRRHAAVIRGDMAAEPDARLAASRAIIILRDDDEERYTETH